MFGQDIGIDLGTASVLDYIKGKGIEDLDSYIVPISLNDNQGAMGCIKLAVEAENN